MDPIVNPVSAVTDNSTGQTTSAQTSVNDDLARALASVQAGPQENMNFETVGEPELAGIPAVPPLDVDAPVMAAAPVAPTSTPAPIVSADDDAVEYSTPPASIDHTDDVQASVDAGSDSIEQIKISALQQLRPLMQHIDLSPEERFEKYLMMLRASDDPSLIEPTYSAAQQIASEKLKAQALLDVINEINYLSSQQIV